jgi:cell filamentation protein
VTTPSASSARLQVEDALTGPPPRELVERLGTFWGTLDSVHPFREGNARTEVVFFHMVCRNAGYDLGAEQLHARRQEFIAARFHGRATGDRYKRLTALLSSTVQERERESLELTGRGRQWAQGLVRDAARDVDLIRRAQGPSREQGGPSLEL